MASSKVYTKTGFSKKYERNYANYPKFVSGNLVKEVPEFKNLWKHQVKFFSAVKDKDKWFINAPTASGKTTTINVCVAYKLNKNKSLRAVIAVPQTIIADGFKDDKVCTPCMGNIFFSPNTFLCDGIEVSNTKALSSFMCKEVGSELNDRICICTHATLVRTYKANPNLFDKNSLVVIDEAHHSMLEEDQTNGLGMVVSGLIESNSEIGLSTATNFRGDRYSLLGAHEDKFHKVVMAYDEFLQNCKWLDSFNFDFLMYKGRLREAVESVFKDGLKKTIVWVPPVQSSYSKGKLNDLQEVYKGLSGSDKSEVEIDGPVTKVKRGNGWVRVVELVDDSEDRQYKKDYISASHRSDNGEDIDVIIALGMFKEGANWKWAEQGVIVGPKNSLTEVMQMIGRFFRDAPNKEHVDIIQALPFSEEEIKGEASEVFNNILKAVVCSLLLEDIVKPAEIRLKRKGKKDRRIKTDLLSEALDFDQSLKAQIFEEIHQRALEDENPERLCDQDTFIQEIITPILDEFEVNHPDKDITNRVIAHQVYKTIKTRSKSSVEAMKKLVEGLNVEDLDINLMAKHPLGYVGYYASQIISQPTFAKMRTIIQSERDKAWEIGYKHLLAFYEEHGHCNVPTNYVSYADVG